jgi:GTP cyclohydrolase I
MTIEDIAVPQRIDRERIERGMAEILAGLPIRTDTEGVRDTPRRAGEMYAELFAGLEQDPADVLGEGFQEKYDEMVLARDISFYSMCEHHFLPFFGVAHIGYVPRGRVVGISKLARLTEVYARRPQVQERMTAQIADTLMDTLDPIGVAVVIEAEHLCMAMRGVSKSGARIVTSVTRGVFRDDPRTRAEFLGLTQ